MSAITTVLAPAKLNLFLHITGRRTDGYHLLESAFTCINLCDTLDFQIADDGKISRVNTIENLPEAQDLIIRAAHALRARAQADGLVGATKCGARLSVEKRIPMGGGFGGGSSDAATTLKTLNTMWGFNYSLDVLAEIGLKLGADVPFFIFERNAFAQGIGEQLQPVNLPNFAYFVVKPDAHVPTPAIFAAPELTRSTKTLTILDFSADMRGNLVTEKKHDEVRQLSFTAAHLASFKNDMQPVVEKRFVAVAEALALMQELSAEISLIPARMTGSGAGIFAAFASAENALLVQQKWQQKVALLDDNSNSSLLRAKTFVVTPFHSS